MKCSLITYILIRFVTIISHFGSPQRKEKAALSRFHHIHVSLVAEFYFELSALCLMDVFESVSNHTFFLKERFFLRMLWI